MGIESQAMSGGDPEFHDWVRRLESGEESAEIFKAQAMMLDDPELVGTVKTAVEEQKINVESALADTAENFAQMLEALEDEFGDF